jgi:adenine modification enzyme
MNKYILSDQISLYGEPDCIGFGNDEFYIKEIDRKIANEIIIKNHYSKKIFNNSYIHLGLFEKNNLLGVLQYGHLLNNNSVGSIVSGTDNGNALELNRMWLSDKIIIKYPESQAISYSIKYIKRKFPKIKWIQSFADERCGGFGIVYQACSFNYYGEHLSEFYELDGEVYHKIMFTNNGKSASNSTKAKYLKENKEKAIKYELRQFRYIKFLDQREKKKCLLKEQPYPKHYSNE